MLELLNLDGELMKLLMSEFGRTDEESLHIVLTDNASAHRGGKDKGYREYYLYVFSASMCRS